MDLLLNKQKLNQKYKFPYKWYLKDGYYVPGIEYHGSKVFSCFSCGGGSTMGYKLAGYDVIGCNDIDEKMMENYIENHHPKYSFLESIIDFKNRTDFPDELYDLDILDGSPPCSSFSMAGNREKDWGKNKKFREGQSEQILDTLFFDFIELGKKLRPKIIIAENVKGLLFGDAITYVRKIYKEFDDAGYYCQHWLLDASKMGVPQKRERVFFVALRKDLSNQFLYQKDFFSIVPYLKLEFNEPEIKFGKVRSKEGKDYSNTDRGKIIKYAEKNDKNLADVNLRINKKISGFNSIICHDNQVRPTITAGEKDFRFYDKMGCSDHDYIVCGTFPLDYNFITNLKEGPKYIIGMSVPPVMMAQISHQIYLQWLIKI